MKLMRRMSGDRAVLGSLGVLVSFAVVAVLISTTSTEVRTNDQRAMAAARSQIEASHAVSIEALRLADGDATRSATFGATLESLRAGHRALRFGDASSGMPGIGRTAVGSLLASAEDALTRLVSAAGRVVAAPEEPAITELVEAAAAYRTDMSRVAGALAAEASSHAVVAKQLSLVIVAVGFSIAIFLLMLASQRRAGMARDAARSGRVGELDQLTGLVRRAALRDRLIDAIHRRPDADSFVALLLIGVRTSARYTSTQMDAMVLETARRLRATVRSTDTVARTGRQQFAVVIDRSPRVEDAGRVAAKLLEALSHPIDADGEAIDVTPAVGIALSPLDAPSGDELLERAAVAQRVAEGRTAPAYRHFSPELRPIATSRGQLTESLREALAGSDQLWIAYQPKIRLRDGAMIGFEALLRWEHPTLGPLRPEEFVPLAEESDLINELGCWVVEEVCRQLAAWSRTRRRVVPVSVNVSTRQFRAGDLDVIVSSALSRHGLAPGLIEIELTEGVLIDDHERPLTHMEDLRRLGVRISVDDFGTGYSSLSYLKRFPIDTLKIDRSFISELREDSEDAAISTAIIALAHSLELDVIAEGVETREQLDILIDLGCDAAQGYYFSEPVPAEEAEQLWRQRVRVG